MTCNTFASGSSKFSDTAMTAEQLNASLYSFDELIALENDPTIAYGVDLISENINYVTIVSSIIDMSKYPILKARLKQGTITTSEFADFLQFSGFVPQQINAIFLPVISGTDDTAIVTAGTVAVNRITDSKVLNVITQLDFFYDKNFSSTITGGFCKLFSSALALLPLIGGAVKLLADLKNSVASILAKLTSIKEILHTLVDKLKEKLMSTIQQLASTVANVKRGFALFANKAKGALDFFSDLNIKSIKAKIEEIIAKMSAGYRTITPQVLQYILYRLCQLTEVIHNLMNSPVEGFRSLIGNYKAQETIMTNLSNASQLKAVSAGAYRPDSWSVPGDKEYIANAINGSSSGAATDTGGNFITRDFTTSERDLAMSVITATQAQIRSKGYAAAQFITFSDGVVNMDSIGSGYKEIQTTTLMLGIRIAKRLGLTLFVTSGYRSRAYNDAIRRRGGGAAKNSLHISGKALDISHGSLGNKELFIKTASEEGAGGIGTYSTFIHIDTGNRRAWSQVGITPAQIHHKNDNYRKGQGQPAPTAPPTTTQQNPVFTETGSIAL